MSLLMRQMRRGLTLNAMVVDGCGGYTRGCRCPRCQQRRSDSLDVVGLPRIDERAQRERRALLRQRQATLREAARRNCEPRTPDDVPNSEGKAQPGTDAKTADLLPRRIAREYARIKHLHGQLAALRDLLATALPGPDGAELTLRQTHQLAELLEAHRDELRAVLNGEATLDGRAPEPSDSAADNGLL